MLRSCHDQESNDVKQDLDEDTSLLLTLGKLHYFRRDGAEAEDYFDHSIRLNAIKYDGIWYEIQKLQHGYIQIHDLPTMVNYVQALTAYDFLTLGFPSTLYHEGKNGDGLIFNPKENMIKVSDLDFQHPFICSHKRISKPGLSIKSLNIKKSIKNKSVPLSFQEMLVQVELQNVMIEELVTTVNVSVSMVMMETNVILKTMMLFWIGLQKKTT